MRHPSHTHNHSSPHAYYHHGLCSRVLVLASLLLLLFYSGAPESFCQGRRNPSAGYGQGYKVVVEPIQKTKTDSRAGQSTVHAPLKSNLGFMVIVVESAVRGGILLSTHDSRTPHTSTEMYIPVVLDMMMMTNNGWPAQHPKTAKL